MRLTPHFDLSEFTVSQEAIRRGIDNTPPPPIMTRLQNPTAERMERTRSILGNRTILISSGYRSPALNAAVGGAANSAHVQGLAVDFTCPSFGTPYAICRELVPYAEALDYDQLIHEFGAWVHIGFAMAGAKARRQVLTIDSAGTREGL